MTSCLIKNSEYRTKLALSGISEDIFYSFANAFSLQYGRLPNLDEIPKANSSEYLKKEFGINKNNGADINTILNITQTTDIQEANIKINDTYSDLEVNILPLNERAIVTYLRRPSQYEVEDVAKSEISQDINSAVIFNKMFDKLRNLYGINIKTVTDAELQELEGFEELHSVSAFVHNGEIYLNTDLANVDAPIHEMMHVLLGSVRFKNPELYLKLLGYAEGFPTLEVILKNNPNRVHSDLLEEALVEELGKHFAGMGSYINELSPSTLYEIEYNIKRLLDTVLMGLFSVKSINQSIYDKSLIELASIINSAEFEINTIGAMDDATLHRMLSNKKEDLIKNGDLREEC